MASIHSRGRVKRCLPRCVAVPECRTARSLREVGTAPEEDRLNAQHKLVRQIFKRDRSLDFFTESGLATQIGYARSYWPAVLLKELIDNALDACESADVVPTVTILLEEDSLTVSDNGPGLPESTVAASLDYAVRVSDKIAYVAPTRGQLGNALKCVWALPYVAGEDSTGVVEVDACGVHHRIEITGSNQAPEIVDTRKNGHVKKGTSVKVHWPGLASLTLESETRDFYNAVAQFGCLNPHANFILQRPDAKVATFPASSKHWRKWRADQPTSAHWYSAESFRNLVTAYRSNGQEGKTVREFVSEFDGLRGSQYQQEVIADAKVTGTLGDLSEGAIKCLLEAMKDATREVLPQRLGVIGPDHFRKTLLALGISENSFKYKKKLGIEDGLPFIVEAAFGVKKRADDVRNLVMGLNFSPTFRVPSQHFENELDATSVYDDDPVVVAVHQVTPQLRFVTLGKSEIADEKPAIRMALSETIERVTDRYTKKKLQARRYKERHLRQEALDELNDERSEKRSEKDVIQSAAYQVMEEAYLMASGDGRLPANARQVMYAARPLVLKITGGKCWSKSSYFTQKLLPDYQKEYPVETADWNVVYDARGHFREPHTGISFGIGTLEVREYVAAWKTGSTSTRGPANRFKNALFVEKEGFDSLLEESRLAERFDISILSTKGMSTTSARELIEALDNAGVRTFVAHDFDLSGFGIFHTLGHDTKRHEFETLPNVIDLGLRLTDVQEMRLQSEPYELEQEKDPKIKLREYGASRDELDFLIGEYHAIGKRRYWDGTRVELNSMTSVQFIAWLERKLVENGVKKLVPEMEILSPIWLDRQKAGALELFKDSNGDQLRAIEAQLEEARAQLQRDFDAQYKTPRPPRNLKDQVAEYLRLNPLEPWDTAIARIAEVRRER